MKRIASILLTTVLVITSCGIGAFADDAKAAEQPKSLTQSAVKTESAKTATTETKAAAQSSDAYDITKWNFHLDKTTFEYGVMKDKAKSYYGKHDEIAREKNIYKHLKYTAPKGVEPEIGEDITLKITGSNDTGDNGELYPKPGKHTLVVTAVKAPFSGQVKISFKVNPFRMSDRSFSVYPRNRNAYTYDGKAKHPSVSLCFAYIDKWGFSAVDLKKGKDIQPTYIYKNNKKVGWAKVIVKAKFKGRFTGTATASTSFVICPKKTKITKVKVGKTSLKVRWKKRKDVTGYRIRVQGNDLENKYYTVKNKNKTSIKIKGLKRHDDIWVSVYTYKKVRGKKIESYGAPSRNVQTH